MADSDREIFDRVAESFAVREDSETIALREARYERKGQTVVLDFVDRSTFSIPVTTLAGLRDAADEDLAEIEIIGDDVIHFPRLDAFYEVAALMAQRVGMNALMAHLAGRSGRVSTPAKAAAARANGAKGGRPKKGKAA